jgi:hypothetical protein
MSLSALPRSLPCSSKRDHAWECPLSSAKHSMDMSGGWFRREMNHSSQGTKWTQTPTPTGDEDTVQRCYSLNMKCPWQAHVLKVWSPNWQAILGGSGNFKRWGLVEGSKSLGVCPWSLCLVLGLGPIPPICFLSTMMWMNSSITHSHLRDVHCAQGHGAKQPWTEPFETTSQNKSSFP